MTRWQKLLSAVVALELAAGAILAIMQASRPQAPLPDLSRVDNETATALHELREIARDGDARDWRELAEGYLGTGYYTAAEQCFRRATLLDPGDMQAEYGLAFCLERTGRTSAAIPIFRSVAETADSDLSQTCWYQTGRCFLREDNTVDAEAAFRRIEKFPPAVYQLSKILIRTGRADEAVPLIEEYLAATPNCLKFLQLRGKAAEALDDLKTTEEMRDREDRGEYLTHLEYSLEFIGMLGTKFGLGSRLARGLKLKEEGTAAQQQMSLTGAVALIREHRFWQYRSAFVALAEVELALGHLDRVHELISEVRQISYDGADLLELEGKAVYAAGRDSEAAALWKRAYLIRPTIDLCDELAMIASDPSDKNEYMAQRERIYGQQLMLTKDAGAALAHFEAANALTPENPAILFSLGDAARVLGDKETAESCFRSCLRIQPAHGRAMQRLAWMGLQS